VLRPALIRWNFWDKSSEQCGRDCTRHADIVAEGLRYDLIVAKIRSSPDILNRKSPTSFRDASVGRPADVPRNEPR
ncbi:MAG: hypothetical protein ABW136_05965, partial [Steroidobacteraceae bacterium]